MFRCFCLLLLTVAGSAPAQTILVGPYLQPGNGTKLEGTDVKVIAWVTDQQPGEFTVEYGAGALLQTRAKPVQTKLDFGLPPPATPAPKPSATPVPNPVTTPKPVATPNPVTAPTPNPLSDAATDLEEVKKAAAKESAVVTPEKLQHYFTYAATLEGLPFDSIVRYRVKLGAKVVRQGAFRTRASATKPIRFVAVGDLANGKPEQSGIAWQIARQKPDFMVALGDIVYPQGRVIQYMHHFWPIYNDGARPGPKTGALAVFLDLTLYPVIGNHDADMAKLPEYPDAFGAYYFFHVPQNGPGSGAWNLPLGKDTAVAAAFRANVGAPIPR